MRKKLELNFKSEEDKAEYEKLKEKQNAIYQRYNKPLDGIFAVTCIICSVLTLFFFIMGGSPFYDDLPD